MRRIQTVSILILSALLAGTARADWVDQLLRKARKLETKPDPRAAGLALSEEEMVCGLKEALAQGSRQAIARLGRMKGFSTYRWSAPVSLGRLL